LPLWSTVAADRQYRRIKSLVSQRSDSESLLDERKRDLDTSRALLVAIESRLADRLIKAPFARMLGLRNISPETLVEAGELITTLDNDSVMKLDFALPSVFLTDLIFQPYEQKQSYSVYPPFCPDRSAISA
jgi:membrane fusion protein, multidrug efflux system